MPKGISIHIGLNYVDASHYGSKNELPYCDNDAFAMRALAHKEGYTIQAVLLNEEATVRNLLHALDDAADALHAGDILLLTYSGHGSQFPDLNGDEEDKFDEAWVLYDRLLLDDELYYAWSKFRAGVRIVLVSDSCHAGTVAKPMLGSFEEAELGKRAIDAFLKADAQKLYKRHKAMYDQQVKFVPLPGELTIGATVILLASCQDMQVSISVSRSGRKLSLFTDELVTEYDKKNRAHTYASFLDAIKKRIPAGFQTPTYFTTGATDERFAGQTPFTI